jgi:hypothetical protein
LLGSAGAGYAAGLQRRVRRTVMSMQFLQWWQLRLKAQFGDGPVETV